VTPRLNISTRVTEKEDRGDLMGECWCRSFKRDEGSVEWKRKEKERKKVGESAVSASGNPFLPKAAPTRVHAIRGTRWHSPGGNRVNTLRDARACEGYHEDAKEAIIWKSLSFQRDSRDRGTLMRFLSVII